MRPLRPGVAVLALAAACRRDPPPARAAPTTAAPDAAPRVRARLPAELPPLGASTDRREVDVPLDWIHLVEDPAPTGGAPNVVVGARMPCGYRPRYGVPTRAGTDLAVRLRAEWSGAGEPPARPLACRAPTATATLVSLAVLRLGTYRVTDAAPRAAADGAAPTATLRVVPDDDRTPRPVARWVRPCAADGDCAAGGVCARAAGAGLCAPPVDPWLSRGEACVPGATPVEVTRAADAGGPWRVCLPECDAARPCPGGLRCADAAGAGVCVPAGPG